MKKLILCSLLAVLLATIATTILAQGSHTAVLTWTLSVDDAAVNCTAPSVCSQNIYRSAGACPQTFGAALTSVPVTATTYTDTAPLFGNSCYAVTFVVNGVESADSNSAGGSLRPASQTALSVVEK